MVCKDWRLRSWNWKKRQRLPAAGRKVGDGTEAGMLVLAAPRNSLQMLLVALHFTLYFHRTSANILPRLTKLAAIPTPRCYQPWWKWRGQFFLHLNTCRCSNPWHFEYKSRCRIYITSLHVEDQMIKSVGTSGWLPKLDGALKREKVVYLLRFAAFTGHMCNW